MDRWIDLHTHSTTSDGSMTPRELVRYAKERGLSAIALTDHDTIDGVPEALEEGRAIGLEVIPGLEISVDFKPEMHILGYFLNDSYLNIKGILSDLKAGRQKRNLKIIHKLNELGFDATIDEAKSEAWGGVVGRPHLAKLLVKKGYAQSMEEAFDKYLSKGGAAYFKREELTPEQGIREITKAGGIAVLAHPIFLGLSFEALDELVRSLLPDGLKGIEAVYVDNNEAETKMLLELAARYNLLVTGGSDFHGNFKTEIDIGSGRGNLKVPYELLDRLKENAQKNPHSADE